MDAADERMGDLRSGVPAIVFSDFLAGSARPIAGLDWSCNGEFLAVRYRGGEVALWNVRERRFLRSLQSGRFFSWSTTDLSFARGTRGGLAIEHVSKREWRDVHSRPVAASAWSPDGARIVYAPEDRPPKIFNRMGSDKFGLESATPGSRAFLWVRDDVIIAHTASGAIDIMTAAGPAFSRRLEAGGASSAAAHGPTGIVAIGRSDGSIGLRSLDDGVLIGDLAGHRAGVCGLSFSSDGAFLASKDRHGRTVVWQLKSPAPVAVLDDVPAADDDGFLFLSPAVAFNPVGHELAIGSLTAQLWTYRPGLLRPVELEQPSAPLGTGRGEQQRRAPARDQYYDAERRAGASTISLKNASAYVVHFAGGVQVKGRLHESTLRVLVETLSARGAVLSTPHPIDLAMSAPISVLFEVKRVGPRHPMLAVREAVGQLMEYRHFLGPRDAQPCIVLDTNPNDHALVSYVEDELKMLLLWFADGKLCGGVRSSRVLTEVGLFAP